MRHGKGIMRFADGRQYRGKWRLDLVLAPLPSLACPDHSATARAPSPAHAAPARRLLTAERDATCSRTDRVRRSEQTARRTRGSITKDNGTGRAWRPQCMETSTAESGARASVTARSDAASSPAVRGSVARRRVHRRKSVA